MRVNFYEAFLSDDGRTALVKEKAVNYEAARLTDPQAVVLMMHSLTHIGELAEERCYMVALNNSGRVIGVFFLSKGTATASPLSPRELFMRALLAGAAKVILCHNHPSGNTVPSEADMQTTKRIEDAGNLLGIPLEDHIIIGGNCNGDNSYNYLSFREAGLLEKEDKSL